MDTGRTKIDKDIIYKLRIQEKTSLSAWMFITDRLKAAREHGNKRQDNMHKKNGPKNSEIPVYKFWKETKIAKQMRPITLFFILSYFIIFIIYIFR